MSKIPAAGMSVDRITGWICSSMAPRKMSLRWAAMHSTIRSRKPIEPIVPKWLPSLGRAEGGGAEQGGDRRQEGTAKKGRAGGGDALNQQKQEAERAKRAKREA